MKKTKTIKAIALALLCTLLVGAAVGIGISATESATADVSIGMKNLAYNANLNLAVQIVVADGAEGTRGLAVWAADETNLTLDTAIHFTEEIKSDEVDGENIYYAFTHGIAAKDIGTEYQIGVYLRNGNTITVGEIETYSISEYLTTRLSDESITDRQSKLYKAVIAYGDAANGVLTAE